jgi:hypothetical protein
MLQMNGSPSQGLILHEGGHVYTYGLLANNEWQSGWMDEGLTSYQTLWAQGFTPQELARRPGAPPVGPPLADPEVRARRLAAAAAVAANVALVRSGRAQPIGLRGDEFVSLATYNAAVSTRASQMLSALRDVLGDAAFADFLRDYNARWAFRHVDEAALRASAERAGRRDLGWFFDQWVRGVGVVDYALRDVRSARRGAGWVTTATLQRVGAYRHPIAVGARTRAGWVLARGDARADRQRIEIRTRSRPEEVRLDPEGTSGSGSTAYYAFRDGRRVPPPGAVPGRP